jgi:hypothetical protein
MSVPQRNLPSPAATPDAFDELGEESGTYKRPTSRTLSASFWGLDLCRDLPRVLSQRERISVVPGELSRVRAFLADEFPTLTEEALGSRPSPAIAGAKRWYFSEGCDLIELCHDAQTVGVLIGAPEDWGTYYVRILAIKAGFQRPALTRRFGRECLLAPLHAHGVERVVAETSPSNLVMARGLSELNFHVTGHQLSERWGPLVRYTKFLDPACEAAFHRRFAGTAPRHASRGRKEETS